MEIDTKKQWTCLLPLISINAEIHIEGALECPRSSSTPVHLLKKCWPSLRWYQSDDQQSKSTSPVWICKQQDIFLLLICIDEFLPDMRPFPKHHQTCHVGESDTQKGYLASLSQDSLANEAAAEEDKWLAQRRKKWSLKRETQLAHLSFHHIAPSNWIKWGYLSEHCQNDH